MTKLCNVIITSIQKREYCMYVYAHVHVYVYTRVSVYIRVYMFEREHK